MIRNIVASNPDIKVWNLSLGSCLESPENIISPEASMLDKLQNEYDIVFVVAGTNKTREDSRTKPKRIGAPADSINSLVVNATSILKEPASYTREGPVLNFSASQIFPALEVMPPSRWQRGRHKV